MALTLTDGSGDAALPFSLWNASLAGDLAATTTTTMSPANTTLPPQTTGYTALQATLIGISAGLLSFVTILGNLMVMISFKMDKQLQTISNYFLFSLAVADMIIGVISMPLFTVVLIQQQWTLGKIVCDGWLSVDYLASNASVMNLMVVISKCRHR